MDPLSLGLIGIGAAGSIKGMFSKSPSAPSIADLDLQKDNPDLWKELQQLQAMSQEYERLYNQRRMGPTAGELAMQERGRSQIQSNMANSGMLGSSVGNQAIAGYDRQMMDAMAERAFREQQQLLASQMQARQGYAQALQGAQQQAMQGPMANYQNQLREQEAQNRFFGGLLSGGIGMYGASQYANTISPKAPTYSQGIPTMVGPNRYMQYGETMLPGQELYP